MDEMLKLRLDSKAKLLQAIHDEILKTLAKEMPVEIRGDLELIESMCRYSLDIRSESERSF